MTGTLPPHWSRSKLEADRERAIGLFREARIRLPLDRYQKFFDEARAAVEELLELTVDLHDFEPLVAMIEQAGDAENDWEADRLLRALRNLSGPPLSADDLAMLAEVKVYSAKYFTKDLIGLRRAIEIVRNNHDRERFPWLFPDVVEPNDEQKKIAVYSTAALIAMTSSAEALRNDVKAEHDKFAERLTDLGYKLVKRPRITRREELPEPGQFSIRSNIKPEKEDGQQEDEVGQATFVIRRGDGHVVVLLSRSSGSTRNSKKRLVDEVSGRQELWLKTLGAQTTVGVLLDGVYSLKQLEAAQENELNLWWFHSPEPLLEYLGAAPTH